MALRLRELTQEEHTTIELLLHARKVPVGKLKRAQIVWLTNQGLRPAEIAERLHVSERMVRNRLHRRERARIARTGRSTAIWTSGDLPARGRERNYPDGSLPSPGSARGLRHLDAGSAGGLPASGQRHPHEAQSHQRAFHCRRPLMAT